MTTDLIIAGSGGFARETAAAVNATNAIEPTWRLLGFLDDNAALHGTRRSELSVLGAIGEARKRTAACVAVCVGSPRDPGARERVVHRLWLPAERFATLVHPSADIGTGCRLGVGSVLLAQVVLTADVTIGSFVGVMPHAVLTHDNVIEDFATIASGVRLGGGVHIGRGAYVGAGALIREGVTIGAGALVGMGSVVLRDVPPGHVHVGNPARYLRTTEMAHQKQGSVS